MKNIYLLLVLLISGSLAQAQTQISGKTIYANKKEILAGVSVSIHNAADSSLIKADVSGDEGTFAITIPSQKEVLVYFNLVGIQPTWMRIAAEQSVNMGDISLNSVDAGPEVVIKSSVPLVQIQADKTIFNVEGTTNAIGLNALELLRRAPGVVVDNNNNIAVKGKSGITIYIDGRISPLTGDQLADFLKNTPSSSIEKIEIITNPSARFDAAGTAGIMNIIMKKNKNIGQNANISIGYANQVYGKTNTSVNFNKRGEKSNLYINYGNNFGEDWGYMRFFKVQNDIAFNQESFTHSIDKTHYFKTGVDVFINEHHSIGFSTNGNFSNNIWNSHSSTPIISVIQDSTLEALSDNRGIRNNASASINYQWKGKNEQTLVADFSYGGFNIQNNNFQPNAYVTPYGVPLSEDNFQNNTKTIIGLTVGKLDYNFKWKNISWEAGLKATQVNTNNNLNFFFVEGQSLVADSNRTNAFDYIERVLAAYANASGKYKKIGWQIGVRGENTQSIGTLTALSAQSTRAVDRLYTNFFPSAALTFEQSEMSVFNLTYSRRIDRPRYQDLNPFESRIDQLSYSRGNPFLQPQFTDALELSHTLFYMITSSVGYSKTNGFFTEITDTTEFARSFIQTRNLGYQENISFNLGSPLPIAKWWEGYMNLGVYNLHNRATFEDGNTIDLRATSYNVFMQNTFKVNKTTQFELSGFYNGPSVWGGTFRNKPMGGIDGAFQKTFHNEKLILRIAVGDLLGTMRWRGISDYAGLYMDASGKWESRTVRVNFTWKLGNQNIKVKEKKTDDSFKRVK
jgi:iron complex outermembrane recepter protein